MGDEERKKKIEAHNENLIGSYSEASDSNSNGSVSSSVVDKLHGRIRELEVLLGGKEEALEVALQGLDSAMGVEKGYHVQLEGFRTRVGEFQEAVRQRDQVIQQLSASLEKTLKDRDELAQDGERLVQEVSLLRSQLQATSELMAQGSSKTQQDFMVLQNKMLVLEDTLKKKDTCIEDLQRQVLDQESLRKELEHKKGELSQYKAEAASHVQQLMREVERLHQEAANSSSLERQRAHQITALEREHKQQLIKLQAELEEHFGQQLVQVQEKHRLQFTEQLETLNKHHAEELANVSASSSTSDGSLVTQQQLQELSERALQAAMEREELLGQVSHYKEQVLNLSEELSRFSSDAAEEKQSLRVALENENIYFKEQLKSLSDLLEATREEKVQEIDLYREAQASELSSWKKRVESLTAELQKVSLVSQEHLQRFEACNKSHELELNTLRQTHNQELKFLQEQVEGIQRFKAQVDGLQVKLQEKTEMEKRLQNELQTSIRREEELKGRLMQSQEEIQRLSGLVESQKGYLQQQVHLGERLKLEIVEKQKCEAKLRMELKEVKENIAKAKETVEVPMYKEQVDKLNEQLRQKAKLEEVLKSRVQELGELEVTLRKCLEEQATQYKTELDALSKQLSEKTEVEEQLRAELKETMLCAEKLQSELKSLKNSLEELKKTTEEAETYKNQVDILNKQLQERSQSEHRIISDYESRVEVLTSQLHAIEGRLSSEIQGIQARAQEELESKQDSEKRLECELEGVRNELLALKASTQVQEYKEQINELNLLVQDKQKAESALKAELEAVSAEVVLLRENQQQLESFNSGLVERLHTEHRLQEELIAAAKIHKEQVDVLSSKISELTSQQNSLDNEAISMRQEIIAQRSYIHELETIREQVSQTSKTKEALINDLSLCVKSLSEDNSSYQQKLENLNKRLDDECHRADENMMLREMHEREIAEHKKHIEDLESKLQEALHSRDQHIKEISLHQRELEGYKEQLEKLNNAFSDNVSGLHEECQNSLAEKIKEAESLAQDLDCVKEEVSKYKENVDSLNNALANKEMAEKELEAKIQASGIEMECLKEQISEANENIGKQKEEIASCMKRLEEFNSKLRIMEETKSSDEEACRNVVNCLEEDIKKKNEVISRLNIQLEAAALKFEELKRLFEEAQERFSEERKMNSKLAREKEESETIFKAELERISESHLAETEEYVRNVSALQFGLQELTATHERCSKDRDSLNFSSISETELLQLESKLQHALNERNEIEKSFKDHINTLAESHIKEIAVSQEQLRAANEKLEEISKAHMNCSSLKDSFRSHVGKLNSEHQKALEQLKRELRDVNEKFVEISKVHQGCVSEREVFMSSMKEIEKYKEEISKYEEKVSANENALEELTKHHTDCWLRREVIEVQTGNAPGSKEIESSFIEKGREMDAVQSGQQPSMDVSSSVGKEQFKCLNEECDEEHEKELTMYKEQLREAVKKLENLSQTHNRCFEEKESFKESIQKLSESYQKEMTNYSDQLALTNKKLEKISLELSNCSAENSILKENISQISQNNEDIVVYKEHLSSVNIKLEELNKIHTSCTIERDTYLQNLREKDLIASEKDKDLVSKTNELNVCQRELVQTREYMDLLKVNLQDEISKIHVELQNLVNICTPSIELISDKEMLTLKSNESKFMNGNEQCSPDWSQKEGNRSLEDSLICAETINHDVSSLRSHVECLVFHLNSLRQKTTLTEEKLAAKQECEEVLKRQIDVLEKYLERINSENKALQLQVEEMTVKFLATQSLLAGKVEAEQSLVKEVSEIEVNECNKCKHLEEEITALTTEFQAIEEKLKLTKMEHSELLEKNNEMEEKCKKLFMEKEKVESVIENLKSEQNLISKSSSCKLEELRKMSEEVEKKLVSEHSDLKEKYLKLQEEKQKLEEVLDETKSELVHLCELQSKTASHMHADEAQNMAEKCAHEQIRNVEEAQTTCDHGLSGANYSDISAFELADFSLPGLQEIGADGNISLGAVGDISTSTSRSSLHIVVLKLVQKCGALNTVKRALLTESEALRMRLEEREAQELLFNEELAAANSRCEALEQRLQEARSHEPTREALAGAKLALECELRALEGHNSALKAANISLENEVRFLQEEIAGQRNGIKFGDVGAENLVEQGVCKNSEIALLKEQLKVAERDKQTLQKQVEALEMAKQDLLKQFEVFLEEARHTREQLEDAWQERADAEEQLGRARCELALTGLRRDARSYARETTDTLASEKDSPVFNMQREIHMMVEEMAQELVILRRALHTERTRNERLSIEGRPSHEQLEVQQKLELVLKSNTELLQEKQALLNQLEKQQSDLHGQESRACDVSTPQTDLVAQLSVYREQHASLAEAIGSAGVMQETLRQQKEELLAKLKEKEAVEEMLITERAELKCSQLKMQLMQQQLTDKDNLYQVLFQQKTSLQKELELLEQKLREREQMLQMQRSQLQAEIRAQDLRLRRLQLQHRASQVEKRLDSSLHKSPTVSNSPTEDLSGSEVQVHLDAVRLEMQEAHTEALDRLRHHLNSEFALREEAMRAGFNAELCNTQASHREQLASLQQELLAAERELESLRNNQFMKMLGADSYVTGELAESKERYERELDSICMGLDEGQTHLFAVLKHLFEEFARQLVAGTTSFQQKQEQQRITRETAALESKHQLQLGQLRAALENEHVKVLEEIKQKVQKNHKEEHDKELILYRRCTPVHFHSTNSSQVALVHLKHLLYSEYTATLKEVTKSWTDNWKAEVNSQLEALERAIGEEVLALEQLQESPETPCENKDDNAKPLEEKLSGAENLIIKAEEMLERHVQVAEKALQVVGERLEAAFAPVVERTREMTAAGISPDDKEAVASVCETEKDQYRELAQQLSAEHAAEAGRLREMLAQLEAQRGREMEELRQYFEKKVQEMEKHYSEEITSQHSRRISSSSCDSDSEFTTDALLGAGDHALPRIPPLTHICDSCAADPGYKELEERWKGELEKRVEESRSQLSAAKKDLEVHYESELSTLRGQYEEKLSRLAQELSSVQQSAIKAAKTNAGKRLQALWRKEMRAIRARLLSRNPSNSSSSSPIHNQVQVSLDENMTVGEACAPVSEIETEEQESLDDLCVELCSQLRQLESLYRQSFQKQLDKLRKKKDAAEAEDLAVEQASALSVQEVLVKVQVEDKLRREIREELEKELEEQVEKVAEMMKNSAEIEQKMFLENQSQMVNELLIQHRQDLEVLKQQHEMELAKIKSTKRCTSSKQAHATSRQHRITQTEQVAKKMDKSVSPKRCLQKDKEVQTDEPEVLNVSTASQEVQTSPVKTSSWSLDASTERLRAQPFDCDSMSFVLEVPSFPVQEVDIEDEQGDAFCRALSDAQTEYAKNIQAMLFEWMRMLHKIKTGQTFSDYESKFLTDEYISECCAKFKSLLCHLESLHLSEISRLQETLQHQIPVSRSPSVGQEQCGEDQTSSQKLAEIISERDRWRQVGLVLKKLVNELLTYLEECENEVNHTLLTEPAEAVEEIDEISLALDTANLNTSSSTSLPSTPMQKKSKRVHFAPTCLDFKMLISDEKSLLDSIQDDEDLTAKLRVELDTCLEHLRSEAATLMENSILSVGNTPSKRAGSEGTERVEVLVQALTAARQRIVELESERRAGRVEEVAEGFGEQPAHQTAALGMRLQTLSQLQDKARSMLIEGRPSSPQEAQQLRLLDEICREGDRLAEEARREREDLRLQVESADKRLRDTRRFLEEQAAEREQERDEFQQELCRLQEQLKAREKDLADQQRLSREVWLLRDVVAELELQAEAKDARSSHLESRTQELQQALEEQENSRQQLIEELESLRTEGGAELTRQISVLQEQLQAHRLQAEQCRPAALKQMKALIKELEVNVEKRTQQLEALHAMSSNQSSPTEDISVRDIFQCESPEELRATASPSMSGSPVSPLSPPRTPLPLRELTRLQDRLQRHARAEEAALKRTRDLEMQLKASRKAEEEACAERDMLQERVSGQLLRIASLEASVDAGRWKRSPDDKEEDDEEGEDLKELQMLQRRAQDAEEEAERLGVDLETLQKEVQHLKETIVRIETTAAEREQSLVTRLSCAEEAETAFRERYETLQQEIDDLRKDIEPCGGGRLIPLPALFDALLADKNAELDALRRRLRDLEAPKGAGGPSKGTYDSSNLEDIVAQSQTFRGGGDDDDDDDDTTTVTTTTVTTLTGTVSGTVETVRSGATAATSSSEVKQSDETNKLRVQLMNALAEVEAMRVEVSEVPALQEQIRVEQQRADALQRQLEEMEADRAHSDSLMKHAQELKARLKMADTEHARAEYLQVQLDELLAQQKSKEHQDVGTSPPDWPHSPPPLTVITEEEPRSPATPQRKPCETTVQAAKNMARIPSQVTLSPSEEDFPRDVVLLHKRVIELQQLLQDTTRERDDLRRMTEPLPGIEELAGQVEKELEESAQLDSSLLNHIAGVEEEETLGDQCLADIAFDVPQDEFVSKIQQEVFEMVDGWPLVTRQSVVLAEQVPEKEESNQHLKDVEKILQLEKELEEMTMKNKAYAEKEQELCNTIATERERTDELQCALRKEQQRALDLQSQLASQAVRTGLAVDESRQKQTCRELEQERIKVRNLEQQLQVERISLQQMKTKLFTERQRFDTIQRRDAELLQTMRLRLHEATAVRKPSPTCTNQQTHKVPSSSPTTSRLSPQVSDEDMGNKSSRVGHVEQLLPTPPDVSKSAGGSKDSLWIPAEIHSELQRRLDATEDEMKVLRRRYNREREACQQLRAEVSLLRGHNDGLDVQLSEVRSSLTVSQAETDRLARRLRALEEAELRQQNWASTERSLAQEKARQLEADVIRLEAELSAERAVREDAVGENARLQGEIDILSRELESVVTSQAEAKQDSPATSEPPSLRLKEINISLDQQMRDHSKVALTLARLVEERQEMHQKMSILNEQYSLLKVKETAAQTTIVRLNSEKSSITEECIQLRLELARTKERLCLRGGERPDIEELEDRATRTYGRYLRSESFRKALIWQKKYLLVALGGYRETEAITLSQLAVLAGGDTRRVNHLGRRDYHIRFRSAAFAVVAIQRMKFLVRRWCTRRTNGQNILYNNNVESHASGRQSAPGLRSGGGGSFATSSTWSIPASASLGVVLHSPPSQDRCSSWTRTEPASLPHWRSMDALAGTLAPSRLSQFVERCDAIQQRLSLVSLPRTGVTKLKSPQRSDS